MRYFDDYESRRTTNTALSHFDLSGSSWWLRTSVNELEEDVYFISGSQGGGNIWRSGQIDSAWGGGVRPAMWVYIKNN